MITKLALIILTLATAARVHVTIHAMGCTAAPSVLQIVAVTVYATAAVAVWIATRSVFGLPFWPRHLRVVTW